MNEVPNHEYSRSWFSYQVTGIEKPNNRFGLDDDGLYMNGKLCWPVEPVTCLKPNGETEPCESRQTPLPKSRPTDAPRAVPIPKTVLYYEPGGVIADHVKRWRELAQSGDEVEIRGWCGSACTLIMAYVPRERICFGGNASLAFHAARNAETGEVSIQTTTWMFYQYPEDIRNWLKDKDGLVVNNTLTAPGLWSMGYRKCDREAPPIPMTINRGQENKG